MEKTLIGRGKGEGERLRAGGEGYDRGWDSWMASPTQWTWVWINSGSWWWTGRPGVLQSMGSQRVRQDWVTELKRTELKNKMKRAEVSLVLIFLWVEDCLFGMTILNLTRNPKLLFSAFLYNRNITQGLRRLCTPVSYPRNGRMLRNVVKGH